MNSLTFSRDERVIAFVAIAVNKPRSEDRSINWRISGLIVGSPPDNANISTPESERISIPCNASSVVNSSEVFAPAFS